jgi:hypothetical protein
MMVSERRVHCPRLSVRAEEFAIYDDFLPGEAFKALATYANNSTYHQVHRNEVRKVWRLHDGLPLQGATAFLRAEAGTGNAAADASTGVSPLTKFLERLDAVVNDCSDLVGRRAKHWKKVSAAPWIYPAGTGLSLHADSARYSGSYTFFLHQNWGLHWGGYLMVFNPAKYHNSEARVPYSEGFVLPWLSDEVETAQFAEPGLALAILPRPNRLVVIAPTAYHMIARVDANAGQNARVSVAGFFHTAE